MESDKKNSLQELVNVATEEINRLDAIIKRFLKTIRPFRLNIKENSIKETLEQVLTVLKPEIESVGLTLEKNLNVKIDRFLYDDDLIKQAVNNIIKNAIQACAQGSKIEVSVSRQKNNICKIVVTDTGKGIDKNILNKIFDPYFTTREEGSGLGLMIVKRIMDAHGGDVSVMSEKKKGTSVVLTIPMRKIGKKLITQRL